MSDAAGVDLEDAIRVALRDRATSFRPTRRESPARDAPRRRHRKSRLAIVLVAVTALLGVSIGTWALTEDSGSGPVVSGPVERGPSPVGAGAEIPLRVVPTPQPIETSVHSPSGLVPGTHSVSVKPGSRASITVSNQIDIAHNEKKQCIDIQEPSGPGTAWDVSGSCDSGGPEIVPATLQQLFYYPHADSQADATVYYVWTHVPEGTAYVTFESDLLRAWERPLKRVVAFPVENGPVSAVASAFDTDGQPLETVQVARTFSGSRSIPQDEHVYISHEPPWYDLKATLHWCETAPLDEFPLSHSPDGKISPTIKSYDLATGLLVTVDVREYCKQMAVLAPDPGGNISAGFVVSNGKISAVYHELIRRVVGSTEIGTEGARIPIDEAQGRIAAQRAAATARCEAVKNQQPKPPNCV